MAARLLNFWLRGVGRHSPDFGQGKISPRWMELAGLGFLGWAGNILDGF